MQITTINNKPFQEHLKLRYELLLAEKISNIMTLSIIAIICLINYLRFIGN